MKRVHQSLSLLLLLLVIAGFTIALTYAPCYASLCSEEFFGLQTRIHIAIYYALLAGVAAALALRACSTKCALISNAYLSNRRLRMINRQVSTGGLSLAIWIISVTLLTTPLWIHAELDFWGLRADPLGWTDAKIRLAVTGVLGHHADILIRLVIIPVGRHSLLAEGFNLHQGTLLFAHKLVAYLMVVASLTHGVAYFTFVGAYKASKVNSAREEAFSVDNPTLTLSGSRQRGHWYSATFPTGVLATILMLAITITALPTLRRRNYNVFYYTHVSCSLLIFIAVSFHASTDFYFLLPGLLLWTADWAWRIFRGDSGLGCKVDATIRCVGGGWYKISLPASTRSLLTNPRVSNDIDDIELEMQNIGHPLQTYQLNFPSISRLQTHAFSAASVGSHTSGPMFLFQRVASSVEKKQSKLETE
ncbi:hypothetical protein LTR53_003416 [Teratosphaeriaceae sp. CCFEE 6253]|nr:hypothetical protein LTR53_003416 [Teratosphaeriaceae sp. CCFEE 6253]